MCVLCLILVLPLMDAVDAVHAELGLTEELAGQLRKVTGFWSGLKRLEAIARRDPSRVAAYRSMLERGLERLGTQRQLSEEEFQKAISDYWQRYHDLRKDLRIAEHEQRRLPRHMDEWCERFCPNEYRRVCDAWGRVIDQGTAEAFTHLSAVTRELFNAYAGIDGRDIQEPERRTR